MFALEVTEELESWPEQKNHDRQWVNMLNKIYINFCVLSFTCFNCNRILMKGIIMFTVKCKRGIQTVPVRVDVSGTRRVSESYGRGRERA